ncbi:hypothetical protein DPMN_065896 [Dreissena polymorpha]|uniref:Uncharacterized protein n=1 Tax=Dreissena polymorpha TaxID=45954 RepID=A0A9D3YVD7_DREPO|nr:hypothetical protein DPMN_065896 [Dreissena polymorpha]
MESHLFQQGSNFIKGTLRAIHGDSTFSKLTAHCWAFLPEAHIVLKLKVQQKDWTMELRARTINPQKKNGDKESESGVKNRR